MPKRRALLGEEQQQQQQQGCGFGKLQYINMAGVIGDQEPGLTGVYIAGADYLQMYQERAERCCTLPLKLQGRVIMRMLCSKDTTEEVRLQSQHGFRQQHLTPPLLHSFAQFPCASLSCCLLDAGPLPTLGPCSQLLYLDLSGHALSGPLPALPQGLQFLNLSSNGLSQRLPQLASSPSLQYIDLSFNR
jgi:hypothetical protein